MLHLPCDLDPRFASALRRYGDMDLHKMATGPFAHSGRNSKTNHRRRPLCSFAARLVLGTAFVAPVQAGANDLFIDLNTIGFDPSRTNGTVAFPGPGDTLTLTEGTPIVIRDAAGIDVFRADGVLVTNNGSIITSGTDAGVNNLDPNSFGYGDGIFVFESDNATIINNGSVSVGDFFSNALYHWQGENSTTINNGSILIREDILEDNPDWSTWTPPPNNPTEPNPHIVPSTGQPFVTAGASAGIRIDAYDNREDENLPSVALGGHYAENNGTIISYAVQSRGIYIDGANFWTIDDDNDPNTPDVTDDAFFSVDSTLVNNGRILMLATTPSSGIYDASGMRAEAHDATIINNGYIEIRPEGFGIDYNGANGTVINDGTILAFNEDSHGIEHYRNGTTVPADLKPSYTENRGYISVKGDNNHGVSLTGHVGHRFVNSGTVFSHSGYSIEAGDGNQPLLQEDRNIVTLLDGSLLFGDVFVDLRTAEYTSMNFGDGLNATVRFEDGLHMGNGRGSDLPASFWSAHDSHVFDAATNAVYVADLDSYAQQDQAFWEMSALLQDAVDDGVASSGQVAIPALAMLPSDGTEQLGPATNRWAGLFGGGLFAEADGAAPAYDAYSGGVVIGANAEPFGVFGGVAATIVRGDEEVSYETRLATAFGGVTGQVATGIDYSVLAGLALYQTERDVADNRVSGGIDTDTVTYPSIFLSPSIRVDGPIDGSSARVRYNAFWQAGHTFSFPGGTNLSVDDRFAHMVEARLQMQHDLGLGRVIYGVGGIWADGPDMSFDLMGVSRTSPYDDGLSARAFARFDGGFWTVQVGYDTKRQATGSLAAKFEF